MVDRFYDGDPTNNATGEAFRYTENTQDDYRYMHGGDWQGIIDKIPYIKGMGYTAIWISPVTDPQLWGIPDANGTQWPTAYHGYNVYNPNRANRYFGAEDPQESKAILKELVDTCHENGIKVIIDVVPNHVGDYLQGIGSDAHYLTDSTGLKEGTQLQPVAPFNNVQWYHNLGDINWDLEHPHTAESTQMLEDHDLGGLDDIDLDNEDAKSAIYDSIKDWFTYTGADAARVDAAKCMKPSDIHELQEYLGVATFGENFDMDVSFVKDWVGDNAETGMFEFHADQQAIEDAKDAIEKAEEDLADVGWDKVENLLEQDVVTNEEMLEAINSIAEYLPDWAQAVKELIKEETGVDLDLPVYDSGGILRGLGGIKATQGNEIVLPPNISERILQPTSNKQFSDFVNALGLMFGGSRGVLNSPSVQGRMGNIDNHDGRTYVINGVPIGREYADNYTISEICDMMGLVK